MKNTASFTLSNLVNYDHSRLVFNYFAVLVLVGLISFVATSINRYISTSMPTILLLPNAAQITQGILAANIDANDQFQTILANQNLLSSGILKIIKAAEGKNINSLLKPDRPIIFSYQIENLVAKHPNLASQTGTLTKLALSAYQASVLSLTRQDQIFVAEDLSAPLNKIITKSSVTITSSFNIALKSLGLTDNSIAELVSSFGQQIDFQRQIQAGDVITIIIEKFVTGDGQFAHYGKILSACLNLSGKKHNIYRYTDDNILSNGSFFSEDGKSTMKSLLTAPVNSARISSYYGRRKHPVAGYTQMHTGVDFAAPNGTPIYAAGSGVITQMCWKNGYGKFIQIKHNAALSTAYAHASNFAKNLRVGTLVKQGQIIAYVGSTGRSTGAHLHYEVKINGKHVNPLSINARPSIELAGKQLAKFREFTRKIKVFSTELELPIASAN